MGWGRRAVVRKDNALSVLIGKDGDDFLKFEGDEHVALLARTGSGKTAGFTIPNCLHWPESLVVLDIKGEAYEKTAGYRENVLGQRVFRFDPTAHDGRSHCWNPLDVIDRSSPKRFDQIMQQATLLIPEKEVSDKDRFWQQAARMALASILMMLAEMPNERMTYERVFHLFMRADGTRWMLQRIYESRSGKRPRFSQNVIMGITDYIGQAQRLHEDIRKSGSTNFWSWMNPQVAAATDHSHFDLRDFRRRPTTLYVTVSPAAIPRIDMLLRLLFGSLINLNTDLTPQQDPSLKVPLFIILDEFVRLGAMPALTQPAQFARGYGIKLAFILQDKPQLVALSGQAAATDVFNNLGVEIVFGLADIHQAKEYSERMGNSTEEAPTLSMARFFRWFQIKRMGESKSLMGKPLLYPWEIVGMHESKQLILRAGMNPVMTERIRYFQEPAFMDLVMPPPVAPRLNVRVELDDSTIGLPALG